MAFAAHTLPGKPSAMVARIITFGISIHHVSCQGLDIMISSDTTIAVERRQCGGAAAGGEKERLAWVKRWDYNEGDSDRCRALESGACPTFVG